MRKLCPNTGCVTSLDAYCQPVHKMSPTMILRLLLAIGSALVGLFLVELTLFLLAPANELEGRAEAAKALGRPFDSRSRLAVVQALRAEGLDAWPTMKPYLMLAEEGGQGGNRPLAEVNGEPESSLFPLGGIAASTSVYCNEGGLYSIFETDEYGFRNPPGVQGAGQVDAVIVGDSFGNGACVARGADPASLLSSRGLLTISLASPGNGPLIELGTLVEYAAPLRPPIVLWLYFEGNDLKNLTDEMSSEILKKYLRNGFSQNLRNRQPEIDARLRELSNRWEAITRAEEDRAIMRQVRGLVTLYHVRTLLGWTSQDPDFERASELFCKVLARAESVVESWGGQMVFVYLPSWYRYVSGNDPAALAMKPAIEQCVQRSRIPFVDFERVISASDDPLSFFSLGVNPHYNETGYQRLAETLLSQLSD